MRRLRLEVGSTYSYSLGLSNGLLVVLARRDHRLPEDWDEQLHVWASVPLVRVLWSDGEIENVAEEWLLQHEVWEA